MRHLFLPLELFGAFLLALACGGSPASTLTQPSRPEFRVMTFNIQHGLNGAGKYGLEAAAAVIAKVNPDLVGVQELTRNHPAYNCDDQPAKLAEALTSATGRRWNATYQQEWFTQVRDCPQSGRGDGPATEGLGFFSPEPLGTPAHTELWASRLGLRTLLRRGTEVPVIVTHLAHSQQNQSDRMRQLDKLLPWSIAQPGNGQILLGDFNLWPDSPEYQRIREHYRDAWTDAVAAGTARGRMDGVTHKTVRIDYIFYRGDALELVSADNVDTRALTGVEASDHTALVAAFRLK